MNIWRGWRCLFAMSFVLAWNLALAETQPVTINSSSPIQTQFSVWEDPVGEAGLQQVTALADS